MNKKISAIFVSMLFLLTILSISPTVNADAPVVEALKPTEITATTALLKGEIISGSNCEIQFEIMEKYNSSNSWVLSEYHGNFSAGEIFSETVTSLKPETEYKFLACAMNPNGEESWDEEEFTSGNTTAYHTLTISSSPSDGGSTTPSSGSHQYEEGAIVNLQADPSNGYEFDYWSGDDVDGSGSSSETITMNSDKSVTAHFKIEGDTEKPTISITQPTDGSNILVDDFWVYTEAHDNVGVAKVKLYIDDEFIKENLSAPFLFKIEEHEYPIEYGYHTIKVVAYDEADNSAEDSIDLFFGLHYKPRFGRNKEYGENASFYGAQYGSYRFHVYQPWQGSNLIEFGIDKNGDDVVDLWDDNNGEYWDWGSTCNFDLYWTDLGTYDVKVMARAPLTENQPFSDWSDPITVTINISNSRPDKPSKPYNPLGLKTFVKGVSYTFKSEINDPDGNLFYGNFQVNYNDGENLFYAGFGLYDDPAAQEAETTFSFDRIGPSVEIRCQVVDEYHAESEWSDPFIVSVAKSKEKDFNLMAHRLQYNHLLLFGLMIQLLEKLQFSK